MERIDRPVPGADRPLRGVEDVIAAVRFARTHGLLVAVRGGGHSFPGYSVCDGGMVIDLSLLKGLRVDPQTRTVRVQAGVLLGELDRETQALGFVVPAGFVSHTGVTGLTLGGGIGLTMRDRDRVRVPSQSSRAAGPRRPHLLADGCGAPGVLSFYRDWIADCPDELMTLIVQRRTPALPGMPPDLVGQRVVGVVCVCAGSVDDGEEVVRPLKETARRPWTCARPCRSSRINDDVIDIMVDHGHQIESPVTSLALWQMGGAVARVGDGETAFNGRRAGHTFNINGNTMTAEGFAQEREWARGLWTALEPHHPSVYVNFLMEEGEDRVRQAYGAAKYDRLRTLKRKYDPDNFVRLNHNIPPAQTS